MPTDQVYFTFYPHVQLVRGALGASIHDLFDRQVYWVRDAQVASALSLLAKGATVADASMAIGLAEPSLMQYLAVFQNLGVGVAAQQRNAVEAYRPVALRSQARETGVNRRAGTVTVEVSTACVYHCPWCSSHNPLTTMACTCGVWENVGEPLPPDRLAEAVETLSYVGVETLIVRGGEPFLAPERLWAVLEAGWRRGMRCEVHTTGTLLDDEAVRRLAGQAVVLVLLAPAADAASFDDLVGAAGSWSKVSQAMGRLVAANVAFTVKIPVLVGDGTAVGETLTWARQQGARAAVRHDYMLAPVGSLEALAAAVGPHAPADMAVDAALFVKQGQSHPCYDHAYFVACDGRITPCIADRTPIAHLCETDMASVLREELHEPLYRTARLDVPACAACEFRLGCNACAVRTKQARGSSMERHWTCHYSPETATWTPGPSTL